MASKKSPLRGKKRRLTILVSNDDGIDSLGIQALARALKKIGDVVCVAPEREQSTMGHALTLHKPVRLFKVASEPGLEQWAMSGTPADCVYVGIRHVLKRRPDIIVTGINRGVNLGNDLFYSGTVAAAREGAVLNIPAIATSLDFHFEPGQKHPASFEDAAEYMVKLVPQVLEHGLPNNCLLNVNFPNIPFSKIKGTKVTKQGFRFYTDSIKARIDNRGKPYFWLGGKYAGFKQIEGSDCEVLDRGYISITPCRIDMTQYEFQEQLAQWDLDPHSSPKVRKGKASARTAALIGLPVKGSKKKS